jgi:hypothetical protein
MVKVRVNVIQAYGRASVTGATVAVNGEACKETEPGVYETKIASWRPIQQVTVQTDASEWPSETWTTSTFHLINALFSVALFAAALVIPVLLLKQVRHRPSQTRDR